MPRQKNYGPNTGADADPRDISGVDDDTATGDPLATAAEDPDPMLDDVDFDFENQGPLALSGVKLDTDKWEYRWVRFADSNQHDPSNISQTYRDGYRPVPADDMPAYLRNPTKMDSGSPMDGAFAIRDQVLCRRPRAIADKHRAALRKAAAAPMRDITETFDNAMADELKKGQVGTKRPEMTFREVRGRQAVVADDD